MNTQRQADPVAVMRVRIEQLRLELQQISRSTRTASSESQQLRLDDGGSYGARAAELQPHLERKRQFEASRGKEHAMSKKRHGCSAPWPTAPTPVRSRTGLGGRYART